MDHGHLQRWQLDQSAQMQGVADFDVRIKKEADSRGNRREQKQMLAFALRCKLACPH